MPVNVTGLDKLRARLRKAGVTLEESVREAMLESGDDVVATARLMVPRGETGKLANSIRRSEILKSKRGNPMVEVYAGDETTLVKGKSTYFQLARLMEFGTQKITPQPFLIPAFRRNSKSIRSALRKAMRDAIKKANGD